MSSPPSSFLLESSGCNEGRSSTKILDYLYIMHGQNRRFPRGNGYGNNGNNGNNGGGRIAHVGGGSAVSSSSEFSSQNLMNKPYNQLTKEEKILFNQKRRDAQEIKRDTTFKDDQIAINDESQYIWLAKDVIIHPKNGKVWINKVYFRKDGGKPYFMVRINIIHFIYIHQLSTYLLTYYLLLNLLAKGSLSI